MISPRYIQLFDGSIQFIKRGIPPTEVPGYEVDPGDPYIFHPTLMPCQARIFKPISLPCCPEPRMVRCCNKFGYISVTALKCVECERRGERVIN